MTLKFKRYFKTLPLKKTQTFSKLLYCSVDSSVLYVDVLAFIKHAIISPGAN